ncbi:hypothetical protein PybrP1_009292 [[Pythium] brassicae (nom. inval.)]|nr:hypothetical protein PybrP1_009292 [[Pythium] brassicae (nom. inval.)]
MAAGSDAGDGRWRQEGDTTRNAMDGSRSLEDTHVRGSSAATFEELLARELAKAQTQPNDPPPASRSKASAKRPFLKRGDRGWWMNRPGAQARVVKHALVSKDIDGAENAGSLRTTTSAASASQRSSLQLSSAKKSASQPQRQASDTAERTRRPIDEAPRPQQQPQQRTVAAAPRREFQMNTNPPSPPPAPPLSSRPSSSDAARWSVDRPAPPRLSDSMRTTASADTLGMSRVRQSYEAQRERDADELAAFEAIERELAAEKDSYLMEKRQSWQEQQEDNVALLGRQTASTPQYAGFDRADDNLDLDGHSSLLFDDRFDSASLFSQDERRGSDHFAAYRRPYPASELSAISLNDSESWADNLTRQDTGRHVGGAFSPTSQRRSHGYGSFDDAALPYRGSDEFSDALSESRSLRDDVAEPMQAPPVSALMQQFFRSRSADAYDDDDGEFNTSRDSAQSQEEADADRRRAAAATRRHNTNSRAKPSSSSSSVAPSSKLRAGGAVLPVVIEEKLFELEEEVKFYKAETLQLQKKKDALDAAAKKLANERADFARFQDTQRERIAAEWESERAKMRRDEKLLERQVKLKLNAAASLHDRKERGEIDALKAQIVKMQLDEKARAVKWKAMNDNLRQRVVELEDKNRELSDEIKFLEKDRLEQWGKYEALLKERQRPADPPSTTARALDSSHFELDADRDLRTVNDLFAIKDTAETLLKGWQSRHGGDDDGENHSERSSTPEESTTTTRQEAIGFASRAADSGEGERDRRGGAGASKTQATRQIEREIVQPGGKREVLFTDGSKKIFFADGNEKEIDADGHTTIRFTNGDRKETTLTTFPDKTKVYEFPNQQVEKSYPDGTTEISFADGITKTIRPNGDEFSVFPDGTTMLEQKDGLREVTLLNDKKIRYFPDGAMAWVSPQGKETPVRSDAELRKLMESVQ